MARGVQPGPIQIAEERQCELVALGMDLIANDRWELAQLDVIALLLRDGKTAEAETLVATFRRRDIQIENSLHREFIRAARLLTVAAS